MKALTQPSDMIAGQLAFSGKNQRNGGFAAKFFGYISLRQAALIKEEAEDIGRRGVWQSVMLRFVALDQKRQKFDRLFLVVGRGGLGGELKERVGVLRQLFVGVDEAWRSLLNHLGWIG